MKINKKMTFAEIIKASPRAAKVLIEAGMHCVSCPMAGQETLEEGFKAHGLNKKDIDKLVKRINEGKE